MHDFKSRIPIFKLHILKSLFSISHVLKQQNQADPKLFNMILFKEF